MDESRVRIVDIAEELGVSTATVSNVIHGKTKKISAETVKRVEDLLEKRQYIPSMAGILLAQNESKIIGIVINDHEKYEGHTMEDGFIAASLNALTKETGAEGYFLMLKLTTDIEEIPRFASMWNMVGIILTGFCDQDYKRLREKMHIPMVVYDGLISEQGDYVNIDIDHFDGGAKAGKYLKEKGHEKVLCISDNDICMDMERYQGLKSIIPTAQLMIIPADTKERHAFYQQRFQELCTYTAVFAVSDYYAIDLMHYLQAKQVAIPEDMSVVGFDDIREAAGTNPALTTVSQNHQMRAALAIEMLKKQREQKDYQRVCMLPLTFVERGSVSNMHKKM